MQIVVTGAGGFVGGHLIKALIKAGHKVTPWGREQADLRKSFELPSADVLYHIGANAKVYLSKKSPLLDFETNATGTLNTLDACEKAGIKKIIYASSALVYENTWEPDETSKTGYNEYGAGYGISKLTGELYTHYWSKRTGIKSVIFRISNPYGPGMRKNLIFDVIKRNKNDEEVILSTTPDSSTDFIYIDDMISAMLQAVQENFEGIYNLSANRAYANKEIIDAFNTIYSEDIPVKYGDTRLQVKINNSKLTQTGWSPETDLQTGLRRTTDYFINHD